MIAMQAAHVGSQGEHTITVNMVNDELFLSLQNQNLELRTQKMIYLIHVLQFTSPWQIYKTN